jgi:pimeloyl-[acyl-carrier protein] methyl ester esterase
VKYLLLPGLDGTGKLFDRFVAAAPQGASVDVARYPVDREMSYPEYATLVLDTFAPDEPFVIVAESFSGPIAVLVASSHPPTLAGIVLCNTFVYRAAWRGFSYLPWASLFRFPVTTLTVGIHLTGFRHASSWLQPIRSANQPVLPRVRASRLRSALNVDVRNEFASLEIPVMYLRGLQDRLVFSSCVRHATATRPSTSVVQVPGPHLLLQVEPQRSWQEVSSFVSSQCQP